MVSETGPSLASEYRQARVTQSYSNKLDALRKKYAPKPPPEAEGGVVATTKAVAGDIAGGAQEALPSILHGVGKAADEMLDTLTGGLSDRLENWVEEKTGLPVSDVHAAELKPETVTGSLVSDVAQLVAGIAPVAKAAKGVELAASLGKPLTAMVVGAFGDAIAFDEHTERLSNLAQKIPGLPGELAGYLAAEQDDTFAEGKIKQLVEGAGLGIAAEGVVSAAKFTKRWIKARKALPQGETAKPVAEKAAADTGIAAADDAPVFTVKGEPPVPISKPVVPPVKIEAPIPASKPAYTPEEELAGEVIGPAQQGGPSYPPLHTFTDEDVDRLVAENRDFERQAGVRIFGSEQRWKEAERLFKQWGSPDDKIANAARNRLDREFPEWDAFEDAVQGGPAHTLEDARTLRDALSDSLAAHDSPEDAARVAWWGLRRIAPGEVKRILAGEDLGVEKAAATIRIRESLQALSEQGVPRADVDKLIVEVASETSGASPGDVLEIIGEFIQGSTRPRARPDAGPVQTPPAALPAPAARRPGRTAAGEPLRLEEIPARNPPAKNPELRTSQGISEPPPPGHDVPIDVPITYHKDAEAFGVAARGMPKGSTAVTKWGPNGPEIHVGPDFAKAKPEEQKLIIAHEQGHVLWERMEKSAGWNRRDIPPELFQEMETLSRQARKHLWAAMDQPGSKASKELLKRAPWLADEGLPKYLRESRELAADAFSVYRTDPETARKIAPRVSEFFDNAMAKYGGKADAVPGLPEPEQAVRHLFERTEASDVRAERFVAAEANPLVPGEIAIGGKVGNINLARLGTSDDLVDAVRQTAKLLDDETGDLTTKRQSWATVDQLADDLVTNPAAIQKMIAEGTFSAKEIEATRRMLLANAQTIKAMSAKIVAGQATDADKLTYKQVFAYQEGLLRLASGQAREAGRALNILRKAPTPGGLDADTIRELLTEGVPVERLAATVAALGEDATAGAVGKLAKAGSWRAIGDALFESWMGSKFLQPWTHIRNTVGNSLALVWQVPERWAAAQIGSITGNRGVVQGEAGEMAYAAVSSMREAFSAFGTAFRTGLPAEIKGAANNAVKGEIEASGTQFRRKLTAAQLGVDENSWLGKGIDLYSEYINSLGFRTLVASDEMSKLLARRMQIHAVALRTAKKAGLKGDALTDEVTRLVTEPEDWLMKEAVDFSEYVTFQDKMGEASRGMMLVRNSTPFGRYIIPFIRTPANILKFGIARTPIAGITPTFWRDVMKPGAQRDLALAKMGLGTLVSATMATLMIEDKLTGSPPNDRGMRATWDRQGKLPYAVRIGDRWYQYNQLEPMGLALGLAADVAQLMDRSDQMRGLASDPDRLHAAYQKLIDKGYKPEDATRFLERAEEQGAKGFDQIPGMIVTLLQYNLLEKSYLSSMSDLFEVVNAPSAEQKGAAANQFISRLAASFIPGDSTLRWVERIVDPELREARGIVDAAMAMTPGLSDDLPPMVNLWGDPRISAVAYLPFGTKPAVDSPIDQEFERIGYSPNMPQKIIRGAKLTPSEYVEYVALAGNELKIKGLGLKDTLDAIVTGRHPKSRAYRNGSDGPDGGKVTLLQKEIRAFRKAAGNEMERRHADLRALVDATSDMKADARKSVTGPR
jgi:hypothetical protein